MASDEEASDEEPLDLDEYELFRIKKEVKKIEVSVNEFCELQGRRSQDIRRALQKLQRIRNLGQSTMSRINSLKDEMNGEKQLLGHQRDQSYQEGWVNLGSAATQAQRLSENWSDLHLTMKAGFQGLSVDFHAACAYSGYQTSWHSQDSLKVPREKLREVIRQQDKLKDLLDEAEKAFEKMVDEMQ